MRYRVEQAWVVVFPAPIQVRAGESVVLTGREELWDGHRWLWGCGPDGREGWVPDNFVSITDAGAVALVDYDATELSCVVGEILEGVQLVHGWVECRAAGGAVGWVPLRQLREIAIE